MRLALNKEVSFTAIVSDEPTESARYEIFTVDPWHSHALMVLAPPMSGFAYGDLLQVRGILGMPDQTGGDPFIVDPHISIIAHNRGFWLRQALIDFKLLVLKKIGMFLPQDQGAFLGGVTLGGSDGMSELKLKC